ncbi:lipopolysaccharide biosynthesis protein [Ciceribacter ferrooxidans]|uniref:Lipopolysaccharide biosynthesis protein n=1 Tax=Ciceribacter ferrooxidans TaxID=2509717 RepID=A0A4Q2SKG1_9HYPH|nr:lipopolysaccharide biosynthesis protein [Ciceribacter ferrooxidans]RYC04499.1 lipopolysaccharide biosynthesis protein [Ciceribacter ferrooxidans]
MSIPAVIQFAEKLLPSSLHPAFRRLESVLLSDDDNAQSRRKALIAFAIRVVSAAIALVSQIIQARIMGEFEYGIFVFVWVLVVLAGNLSCLGFHATIIRFLPQYQALGEYDSIRGLTHTARRFSMLMASLLAIAGILLLQFAGDRIEAYYVMPLIFGLATLPMIALGDVLEGTARANHWTIGALSPTYLIRPTLILLFMVVAVLFGAPHTATTAMQAALLATYVTSLSQFAVIEWRLRKRFSFNTGKVDFLVWFKVAIPIFLIEGFSFLLTNSDVVIVGLYLDPEQVAVYFAASKTMALVQFVYFAIKTVVAPRFSAMMAQSDVRQLAVFAGNTVRWSFWPSLLMGFAVLLFGRFLLMLFGEAFTSGYILMAILLAGILSKAVVGPGEVLLTMAGRQGLCVWLYVVALATNIALNVILIPHFGLVGAASATAAAMMVEALLLHLAVRASLGIVLFAFANPLAILDRTRPSRS